MRTWLALLVAPLLALADQAVGLTFAAWACAGQHQWVMHGAHALFLLATLAATLFASQLWRATPAHAGADEVTRRRRFVNGLAVGSAALSALVIGAMWMPNWVLSPCFA